MGKNSGIGTLQAEETNYNGSSDGDPIEDSYEPCSTQVEICQGFTLKIGKDESHVFGMSEQIMVEIRIFLEGFYVWFHVDAKSYIGKCSFLWQFAQRISHFFASSNNCSRWVNIRVPSFKAILNFFSPVTW